MTEAKEIVSVIGIVKGCKCLTCATMDREFQLFGASEFYAGAEEALGRASRRKADN